MDLRCYQCGSALADLTLPFGRLDQCRACGRYVHACRMCSHYDPAETSKQCRDDDAEKVHDKVNANFCDYFRASTEAFTGAGHGAEQSARSELQRLFGAATDASQDSAAEHEAKSVLQDAEALFKK